MEKLTYKQAYDKIIEAYFKDEIRIMDPKFCFCGTLNNNECNWGEYLSRLDYRSEIYTLREFNRMENALFNRMSNDCMLNYEERLFNGMCAALEVLKQIHKERGENVDDLEFVKRELIHK